MSIQRGRPRSLWFATPQGLTPVVPRDRAQASLLGTYWNAVRKYVETGDASALRRFEGRVFITHDGRRLRYLTDRGTIRTLAFRGQLDFDDLYVGRRR